MRSTVPQEKERADGGAGESRCPPQRGVRWTLDLQEEVSFLGVEKGNGRCLLRVCVDQSEWKGGLMQ